MAFAVPAHVKGSSFTRGQGAVTCSLGRIRRRPRCSAHSYTYVPSCALSEQLKPSATEDGASAASLGTGKTFASCFSSRIPRWLIERLSDLGFTEPTPVQMRSLEVGLPASAPEGAFNTEPGKDIVIHAQTGCGKTLAYLLPAISAVDPYRASVQALVLVPTQELGMQVYKTLRRLAVAWTSATGDGTTNGFAVLPMLNQADLRRQKLQLRKTAPRIIVGNPGRIAELVESGRLRLDLLRVLVVDEFDACLLDTATTSALQTVLGVRGRERRQTILASATVPQHRHFLRQCVRQCWTNEDIEHVRVEESEGQRVPSTIRHCFAIVDGRKKLSALRALLVRFGDTSGSETVLPRAIVFIMMSRPVVGIVEALNQAMRTTKNTARQDDGKRDIEDQVVGLADDMTVVERAKAMRRFRRGSARVLVATDVAARGLDVEDISHVVHLDLPTDADAYLHRAGRAGRLGRDGVSISLVTPGEEFVITRTANALGIDFKRIGGKANP